MCRILLVGWQQSDDLDFLRDRESVLCNDSVCYGYLNAENAHSSFYGVSLLTVRPLQW